MKLDYSAEDFADEYTKSKDLGLVLGKLFIERFSQKDELGQMIQMLKKWFPNSPEEKLFTEYIAFSVAPIVMAIAAHFQGSDEGAKIALKFSSTFGESLVERGTFTGLITYHAFIDPRVSNYWSAWNHEEKSIRGPYWLGKEACKNFSEQTSTMNIPNIMGLAKMFSEDLMANEKFLDTISLLHWR